MTLTAGTAGNPPPADGAPAEFIEDFDRPELDLSVWVPYYLPMWSSRAESAASFTISDSQLQLRVPSDHPLWCPDQHAPLRASGIQSACFSGPAGSTVGQQPFLPGQVVREQQPTLWGWTPRYGFLEVRAKMVLPAGSMAAVWLVGLETRPERSGEICLVEVFAAELEVDATWHPTAAIGMGVHPFRDPALTDEFEKVRVAIDVTQFHRYAARWQPGRVDFFVDGRHLKTTLQAPDYPMQVMIAVFDFPSGSHAPDPMAASVPAAVPELTIDYIRGHDLDEQPV